MWEKQLYCYWTFQVKRRKKFKQTPVDILDCPNLLLLPHTSWYSNTAILIKRWGMKDSFGEMVELFCCWDFGAKFVLTILRCYGSEVTTRGRPSVSAINPPKPFWCRKYVQDLQLCLFPSLIAPGLLYCINSDDQTNTDSLWITEWPWLLLKTHAIIGPLLSWRLPGGVWFWGRSKKVHRPQLEKLLSYSGKPQPGPGFCPIFDSFFKLSSFGENISWNYLPGGVLVLGEV